MESAWKGRGGTFEVNDNRILEKFGFHHNVIDTINIINLFSTQIAKWMEVSSSSCALPLAVVMLLLI